MLDRDARLGTPLLVALDLGLGQGRRLGLAVGNLGNGGGRGDGGCVGVCRVDEFVLGVLVKRNMFCPILFFSFQEEPTSRKTTLPFLNISGSLL